jgi:hypothetical protein
MEDAIKYAKEGITIIAAWKNPDVNKSGHVTVLAPDSDNKRRPMVYNIGPKEYHGKVSIGLAFSSAKRNDKNNFGYFILKEDLKSYEERTKENDHDEEQGGK